MRQKARQQAPDVQACLLKQWATAVADLAKSVLQNIDGGGVKLIVADNRLDSFAGMNQDFNCGKVVDVVAATLQGLFQRVETTVRNI